MVLSGALFTRRVQFLAALLRTGAPVTRNGDTSRRVRNEASIVLGQRKLLQRIGPGLIHALIFWGFLVLGPTIVIAMIGAVSKHATFPWLGDQGWFALLVDVFAVLVLIGVVSALWIRKVIRPARFVGSHLGEADLILALIATIAITLLLWHASRIALGLNEWPAGDAPVSNLLSRLFGRDGVTRVLERVFVWAHVVTILGFLAYLPRSKHLHIATAAINVWFGRTGAGGRLEPLRFDDPDIPEEDIRFGAGTAADLTWKQMLDTFSCTECGRCQDACPAFATGKLLSPKLLIMGLRDQVFADGGSLVTARAGGGADNGPSSAELELAALVPGAVPEESVWDCVTCGACVQACPVSIEHVDHIVDLRRHLVMVESSFPSEAEPMLRDVERSSNPWGKAQSERADWAADLGVRILEPGEIAPEYLYWVGCASSFDERARKTAEATATLLQRAGVDFAILGPREACTGDPARRMGNEYVFQAFAEQNVETLNASGVGKIITNCPHCFNTLGNEYPDFGGDYEVIHHSEVFARLVAEGRLKPQRSEGLTITYHDSCYLARHNDVLAPPRELIGAVGEPVEMKRSGKETFCCGAGGAHMWMEERGDAINGNRVREAAATGADTLAVACPFCTVMLDDGVQSEGTGMRVADVATLLAEATAPRSEPAT
ncbi:MAG: heterodisulfide reductase-related iron-sulfur binding cluster, partial [Actinomycetota bacterium]|nr:heterodisulfide reductase-related iron-sulfur binding cluster [Actinomycetota bacterium]